MKLVSLANECSMDWTAHNSQEKNGESNSNNSPEVTSLSGSGSGSGSVAMSMSDEAYEEDARDRIGK